MRTLFTVAVTLLAVWVATIGALYAVEDLGEGLGYGVERMVLGDEAEADIEDLGGWLSAREERLDKAGDHLRWAGAVAWVAPPGFRGEVRELIAEARALRGETQALVERVRELDERYEAFGGVVGEPLFVESRGLPDEQVLLRQDALELAQELEAIVDLARSWQELRRQARELAARGEALEARAALERQHLEPFTQRE